MILKLNRELFPVDSIDASVVLPGSKYIANRLLPLCALAQSRSHLSNLVDNDDINTAIAGLAALGYQFTKTDGELTIVPREKRPESPISLFTAHSGTFSRFVTAIAALENVPVSIDCSAKMATRPMVELFESLRALGVIIESPNKCLPATVIGPVKSNHCRLDASRSSQYLSALLIIAPLFSGGLSIEVTGEVVSRAYVDMTIQLMSQLNVEVEEEEQIFKVASGQTYKGGDFTIPCDPVSASYFMGAAAIVGGKVTIKNFDFNSVQGEAKFYRVLQSMGASVERRGDDLTLIGPQALMAIEVDMGGMPDAVQTLAVVASFAKGKTHISNIAHLAFKESNRIEDTANELRKTGIKVESGKDFLTIDGGQPKSADIHTHDDHRMAMSMALLGIKTAGIRIHDAQVVEKSFPRYWEFLEQIGVKSKTF